MTAGWGDDPVPDTELFLMTRQEILNVEIENGDLSLNRSLPLIWFWYMFQSLYLTLDIQETLCVSESSLANGYFMI